MCLARWDYVVLADCLGRSPRVASCYGIDADKHAPIDPTDIDRVAEQVVAIVVGPTR